MDASSSFETLISMYQYIRILIAEDLNINKPIRFRSVVKTAMNNGISFTGWVSQLTIWSLLVTSCTASLTFNNCTLCPHCIYVFCIYPRKTATCSTYSINWLVFITEMKSVYSAVRTGSLNTAVCASYLKVNWTTCGFSRRFLCSLLQAL